MKYVILVAVVTLSALTSQAQYWSSGGGFSTTVGNSMNGQYSVNGIISLAKANPTMSGGNFSAAGGFWSLVSAVETPGAPALFISHSGNQVTICWQNTGGWTLLQNGSLSTPAGWVASTGVTTANGTNSFTISNPFGNVFFRLKR